MGNSVLNGCGSYSDKLIEISTLVKNRKLEDGENLTNKDIWDIDTEIFQAYQKILSQTKDSRSISKAIEYLQKEIENSGRTSDLAQLANVTTQKAIIEVEKNNISTAEFYKSDLLDTAVVCNIVIDKENVEEKIKEIQNGNTKTAAAMVSYERSTAFFEKNKSLIEKNKLVALAWMMRVVANDTIIDSNYIIEKAKQYELDILKENPDGSIVIDEEKLEKLYQAHLPKNSKTTMRTLDDFKKLNEKVGKETIEKGTYEGKDANKIETRIAKRAKSLIGFRLEELIETYNIMTEKGVSGKEILEIQHKIKIIEQVMKEKQNLNEMEKTKPKTLSNISSNKEEDFELSL